MGRILHISWRCHSGCCCWVSECAWSVDIYLHTPIELDISVWSSTPCIECVLFLEEVVSTRRLPFWFPLLSHHPPKIKKRHHWSLPCVYLSNKPNTDLPSPRDPNKTDTTCSHMITVSFFICSPPLAFQLPCSQVLLIALLSPTLQTTPNYFSI